MNYLNCSGTTRVARAASAPMDGLLDERPAHTERDAIADFKSAEPKHRTWPCRLAARVRSQDGFSAGHSGLSLVNRGKHAFTENQAFPLRHAAVEGIFELAHLNGELV
jgi:hypothetical protein